MFTSTHTHAYRLMNTPILMDVGEISTSVFSSRLPDVADYLEVGLPR